MTPPRETAAAGFCTMFGAAPTLLAQAPGRVNLIGEHTDYNDGWVMPMAIGCGTAVAARPRADRRLRIAALDLGASCEIDLAAPIVPAPHGDWSNYPRGVVAAALQHGFDLPGADLAIAGNVPQGAGLSSSASLEVGVALMLAALAGQPDCDRTALALMGQSAEHHFAGCQCGIMDQLVSARAEPGAALLIDCRTMAATAVAMPEDAAVLIVHSGVRRGLVEGEYNLRRQQCEAAAATLGVLALRDASLDLLLAHESRMSADAFRRARHVVSENARTLAAAAALAERDMAVLGTLMAQSHASMRDDFAITTPELDQLADLMAGELGGAGGARMTGGGFGGAAIAIASRTRIEALAEKVQRAYRTPAGDPPQMMIETATVGAHLL